MFKTELFANY